MGKVKETAIAFRRNGLEEMYVDYVPGGYDSGFDALEQSLSEHEVMRLHQQCLIADITKLRDHIKHEVLFKIGFFGDPSSDPKVESMIEEVEVELSRIIKSFS